MTRPSAYILGPHSARRWANDFERGQASSRMPYGAETLSEAGYSVRYSEIEGVPWAPLHHLSRASVSRGGPSLGGVLALLQARRSELFVSLFEDNALSLQRPLACRALRPAVSIVICCWLAQSWPLLSDGDRRALRRSLAAFDHIVVFSTNQVACLRGALEDSGSKLHVVPFGVNVGSFPPREQSTASHGLSVGSDGGRDFPTLAAAARLANVQVRVATAPAMLEGVDTQRLEPLGLLSLDAYRRELEQASFVVIATHAPAYPSGQTVLLEAMATGRACVMTDSPAIRDYVTDEHDVLLVEPHDEAALSRAMRRLADDPALRGRLGIAARHTVERRFSSSQMWQKLASIAEGGRKR